MTWSIVPLAQEDPWLPSADHHELLLLRQLPVWQEGTKLPRWNWKSDTLFLLKAIRGKTQTVLQEKRSKIVDGLYLYSPFLVLMTTQSAFQYSFLPFIHASMGSTFMGMAKQSGAIWYSVSCPRKLQHAEWGRLWSNRQPFGQRMTCSTPWDSCPQINWIQTSKAYVQKYTVHHKCFT